MKKIYFFSIFVCLLLCYNPLQAKKLQVDLSYSSFYSPEHGPYFETYLLVYAKSVNFIKNQNGKSQATIEITMLFKQNDSIKDFKKYDLKSQEISDSNFVNFIDQQRFALPNGNYVFELIIADKNSANTPYKISQEVTIDFPANQVNISGVELIESFKPSTTASIITKSGYDLIPWLSDFYPENLSKITFYAEIYNTEKILGKGEAFLLSYYIESFESLKLQANLIKMKREQCKIVDVVLGEFDISRLPSGNYNLVIEVKDKTNKIVAVNKVFFQRSNPSIRFELKDIAALAVEETFAGKYTNKDTLADYIKSLYPVSTDLEKTFINDQLPKADIRLMQQYFLNFWLQRNNIDPLYEWLIYYKEVEKVNAKYSTRVKKGYDTDRGRVYLQYGPPSDIANKPFDVGVGVGDEGYGTVPYEIWQYYKLKNQSNKKFVFANPDLASNDYTLIHSDAIGEISNPNWRSKLSRQTDVYQEENTKWDQGKAGELYKNPH
ncbi:MAG: GWxTD domain-containing protein [Bacteroidetes bacterium]|nr:GWxTD domain-containing protein [Bacteroidota bacterium]